MRGKIAAGGKTKFVDEKKKFFFLNPKDMSDLLMWLLLKWQLETRSFGRDITLPIPFHKLFSNLKILQVHMGISNAYNKIVIKPI